MVGGRGVGRAMAGSHLEQGGLCLAAVHECPHVGEVCLAQRADRRHLPVRQQKGLQLCSIWSVRTDVLSKSMRWLLQDVRDATQRLTIETVGTTRVNAMCRAIQKQHPGESSFHNSDGSSRNTADEARNAQANNCSQDEVTIKGRVSRASDRRERFLSKEQLPRQLPVAVL